jgi:phage terminase large subunit
MKMTSSSQNNEIAATFHVPPTVVFEWNYFDDLHRYKVNQGGTSSSKTYSILQVIFLRLLESVRIATVVGQDIPNLKRGALLDFTDRILKNNDWMWHYIAQYNRSERAFYFRNGSKLEFTSFDNAQDAKSGKRDILFLNEANGVEYEVFNQLNIRTSEEVYIDYNPTSEFWAHERIVPRNDAVTFYSNFTHNPYCPKSTVDYLYDLKTEDPEAWRVYGLGKTGSIAELCIEKIHIVKKMPRYLKYRGYGLDFGYRAHPTTLINCGLANDNELYFDEVFFAHRMKLEDLNILMNMLGVKKRRKMFADPADGRACDYLKTKGFRIIEAIKGRDSVNYGLSLLNQYKLFVTERSVNMISQQKRYKHKVDKKTGKVLNEPVKMFDDTWDAARYWAMMSVKPRKKVNHQWRGATA